MGRYYKLNRLLLEEDAGKIREELLELENVKAVEFADDNTGVVITAEEEAYPAIMDRAVNIFSREAGAELSFDHFVFE